MDIETYAILKNKLDTSNRKIMRSKNLFNTIFERGFLSSGTGLPIPDSPSGVGVRTRDFIEVAEEAENITFQRVDLDSVISASIVLAYDKDKKFIKKLNFNLIKVPGKVCYNVALTSDVRFLKVASVISKDKTEIDFETYANSMNFQVECGLEATEYEPYKLLVKKECVESLEELIKRVEELEALVKN